MKSEYDIVYHLAEKACEAIAHAVRRDLQRMREGLQSGDDSGLLTLWDEICVQAQGEESVFWDLYEDTIHNLALNRVRDLDEYTKAAIWYQTDNGMDFLSRCEEDQSWPNQDFCAPDDDIARYIADEVTSIAGRWTNERTRAYLERDAARSEMDYSW